MSTYLLLQAAHLPDHELIAQVKLLAEREREATVVLIAHLAVLDERRLYLAEGYSSLFSYCTQVLHLSEHAAYGRIEAARAARKFPGILERLADGSVNLTTVGLLAPHLTADNQQALLDEARHKTKREVEELAVQLRPQPPVPSTIRRLPVSRHMAPAAENEQAAGSLIDSRLLALPSTLPSVEAASCPSPAPGPVPPSRRGIVEPLAPRQYKVQFTADAETHEKLRLAQDLLRHQIPDGDLGKIIDLALTALLKDLGKQKHAATDRPCDEGRPRHGVPSRQALHPQEADRPGLDGREAEGRRRGAPSRSRHVPAEVKRAVWARDGGRCAFVADNGRRCTERGFLEFHHVVPYGAGGEATTGNVQLRCRAHNGYEAELFFGGNVRVVREGRISSWPEGLCSQLGPDRVDCDGLHASSNVTAKLSPWSASPTIER